MAEELKKIRIQMGYLTIKEICAMFGCGRECVDYGINTGRLKYMSPNNRLRIIKVEDFVEYMEQIGK